jgi:hypothetical protein
MDTRCGHSFLFVFLLQKITDQPSHLLHLLLEQSLMIEVTSDLLVGVFRHARDVPGDGGDGFVAFRTGRQADFADQELRIGHEQDASVDQIPGIVFGHHEPSVLTDLEYGPGQIVTRTEKVLDFRVIEQPASFRIEEGKDVVGCSLNGESKGTL